MGRFVGTRLGSFLGIVLTGVLSSSCAVGQSSQLAQNVATNIPVLIVAEDQDKTSFYHCSDVHRRVMSELKGSMQRYGFLYKPCVLVGSKNRSELDFDFNRD